MINVNAVKLVALMAIGSQAGASMTQQVDSIRGVKGCYQVSGRSGHHRFSKMIIEPTGLYSLSNEPCESRGVGSCGATLTLNDEGGVQLQKFSGALIAQNPAFGSAMIVGHPQTGNDNFIWMIMAVEYGPGRNVEAMILGDASGQPPFEVRRCLAREERPSPHLPPRPLTY